MIELEGQSGAVTGSELNGNETIDREMNNKGEGRESSKSKSKSKSNSNSSELYENIVQGANENATRSQRSRSSKGRGSKSVKRARKQDTPVDNSPNLPTVK